MGIAMLLEPVASAFPERTLVGSRDGGLSAGDLLALAGVRFTPLNYRLPAAQIAELAAGLGQHTVLVADEQYALAVRDVPGVDVLTTGDWLAAVIVALPDAGLDGDEVREFARARLRGCAAARLRGSRTPDDVVFRSELPHTATGKLLRRELVRDVRGSDVGS